MMVFLKLLENKIAKHWRVFGIALLFFIFLWLRLYRLGAHDFWYDEIGTIGYAQYPWGNWNAPLYWILLPLSVFAFRYAVRKVKENGSLVHY